MESVVVRINDIVSGEDAALNMIDDINSKISLKKYSVGILFCSSSLECLEVSALIKTLKCKMNINILGCSSAGEIINDGFFDDSAVLMILTDDKPRFYSGVIEDIKHKSKEELEKIIKLEYENAFKFYGNNKPSMMITFLSNKSIESIKYILDIINKNYKDLPMFGGSSAIDFEDYTQVFKEFYDGIVYEGAMSFFLIKTEEEPIIAYENIKCLHNNDVIIDGIITDCETNVIKKINNMPAYDFIKKSIGVDLSLSELYSLYPLLIQEPE